MSVRSVGIGAFAAMAALFAACASYVANVDGRQEVSLSPSQAELGELGAVSYSGVRPS